MAARQLLLVQQLPLLLLLPRALVAAWVALLQVLQQAGVAPQLRQLLRAQALQLASEVPQVHLLLLLLPAVAQMLQLQDLARHP